MNTEYVFSEKNYFFSREYPMKLKKNKDIFDSIKF